MNAWFEMLIGLSVAGSTVVVCILVLKRFSENEFSAKWNNLIRKITMLFFLVPVWFIVQKLLSLSIKSSNAISTMQAGYLKGAISESEGADSNVVWIED